MKKEKIDRAGYESAKNYNSGMDAERAYIYAKTGLYVKASNLPHTAGGDFGDIQIKSFHATLCTKTTSIDEYLKQDRAQRYVYVCKDGETCYLMDKKEWRAFISEFSCIDRESSKNDAQRREKLRLKRCENKIVEWCEARI